MQSVQYLQPLQCWFENSTKTFHDEPFISKSQAENHIHFHDVQVPLMKYRKEITAGSSVWLSLSSCTGEPTRKVLSSASHIEGSSILQITRVYSTKVICHTAIGLLHTLTDVQFICRILLKKDPKTQVMFHKGFAYTCVHVHKCAYASTHIKKKNHLYLAVSMQQDIFLHVLVYIHVIYCTQM